MYASGSTWLFNAARDTAVAALPEQRVTGLYAETLDVLRGLDPAVLNVVKTHHLPQDATNFMALNATRILVSIRDPRDAVTSLMQHMGLPFAMALQWVERSGAFCAHFARDKRAELFVYESWFTDDPATFDRLEAACGGSLGTQARAELFTQSRRSVIEAKIARLEELPTMWRNERSGDLVDTATHWHRHHAGRTGEVARWARLLPEEAARVIEARMADWMRRFGYLA